MDDKKDLYIIGEKPQTEKGYINTVNEGRVFKLVFMKSGAWLLFEKDGGNHCHYFPSPPATIDHVDNDYLYGCFGEKLTDDDVDFIKREYKRQFAQGYQEID